MAPAWSAMLFLKRERPTAPRPARYVKSAESWAFERAFGHVFRCHREALDMAQTDLGEALGMSSAKVCRIERAERPVTLDTMIQACMEFDVDPVQLVVAVQREAFPFGWYGDEVDLSHDVGQLELPLFYREPWEE